MAALPTSVHELLRLFSFLIISFFLISTAATTIPSNGFPLMNHSRLVTKLVHRDSLRSPYYNPNATVSDRAKQAMRSSVTRLVYLEAKSKTSSLRNDDARAGVIAENGGTAFLANFSIGSPPVPQLAVIDTASSLLWVQCLPCTRCFQQVGPIFDPSKSSTYALVPCGSPSCPVLPRNPCNSGTYCRYSVGYLDGTSSAGTLATETITVETSDEGTTALHGVVFGCGHNNEGYGGQLSGILGLGPHNESLVWRLGSRFSYCIGSVSDPHYLHNHLVVGSGAQLEGDSTPVELLNGLYYVTLEAITVGETKLSIDQPTFQRTASGSGGVIIDSGSTVTWLTREAYKQLSAEVQLLIQGLQLERVVDWYNPRELCYKGAVSRDLAGFPAVTFRFAGGAELVLEAGSLFQDSGAGEFCMAVSESPKELNIIGIMAQQFYNVGYDLVGKKVFFQRIGCELLGS